MSYSGWRSLDSFSARVGIKDLSVQFELDFLANLFKQLICNLTNHHHRCPLSKEGDGQGCAIERPTRCMVVTRHVLDDDLRKHCRCATLSRANKTYRPMMVEQ